MSRVVPLALVIDGTLAVVLGRRYPMRFWTALLPGPIKEEILDCFAHTPDAAIRLMGAIEVSIGLFMLLRHRRRERSAAPTD